MRKDYKRYRTTIVRCKNCKQDFPAINSRIKAGEGKFCTRNCHMEFRRKNKIDIKRRRKNEQLKFHYGITIEEYEKMLEDCGFVCSICQKDLKDKRRFLDHDHATGKIRGILCGNCNTGIGMFNDDTFSMLKAIDYIERNR